MWSERGLYTARVVEMGRANPFTPGTGGVPPFLAGREWEQRQVRRLLGRLRAGLSPGAPVVFWGPRGNGKTALLGWTEREVEAAEGLDRIWITPADIPDPEVLMRRLGFEPLVERCLAENPPVGDAAMVREVIAGPALEARSKKKPFVLFLDEAHTVAAEVGRLLLSAAGSAGPDAPFLLLLAGTPDLLDRFSGFGVSLSDTADIHPVGRLDSEATAEAIRHPLADDGIEIEPGALERIVRESDGYPYFVQLWGRAVWKGAVPSPDGGRRVTGAVVDEAAPEFETTRNRHFGTRYKELKKAGLLRVGREVALAFRGNERLPHGGLREVVRRATGNGGTDDKEAARVLKHLGFVWQSDVAPTWEPGIPSLMDYILENAPAPGS